MPGVTGGYLIACVTQRYPHTVARYVPIRVQLARNAANDNAERVVHYREHFQIRKPRGASTILLDTIISECTST